MTECRARPGKFWNWLANPRRTPVPFGLASAERLAGGLRGAGLAGGTPVAFLIAALLFASDAFAAPSPARQQALRELVNQDCGSCHGMTRKGGLGAPLTAEALDGIGDEAVAATILDGRPGTPMPPWRGLLSDDDALWIARHLKGEGP